MIKILKIGGNVINNETLLNDVLRDFASIHSPKIIVHGGGKIATHIAEKLEIPTQMYEGRRITDKASLDVVTMVYAGLLNKKIVATLQAQNCNAIGLSGADGNLIQATKRAAIPIDFGYVGDLSTQSINITLLETLLKNGLTPVFSAITHDKKGNLLNTNADTIATQLAISLSTIDEVELIYCFEKKGVLLDITDENSYIPIINYKKYQELLSQSLIFEGMLPKLSNAFDAINKGVSKVILCNPQNIKTQKEKTILCQ